MTGPSPFLQVAPSDWIASNDLAFAIRDGFPVSPGHALVVPRRVVATWWEASEGERAAILSLVDVVRARLLLERRPDGFNVGFNSGAAAGQTVPHLHLHVIPRYAGDVPDPRGGVRWVVPAKANYLAPGGAVASVPPELLPGGDDRTLRKLESLFLDPAHDRADLVVSFVLRSGVEALAGAFEQVLERDVRVRILTTDYLGVTEPAALLRLLDWADDAAGKLEVRVFRSGETSFHPKAYIFWSSRSRATTAIVGSSNLSRSGLAGGIEWNLVAGSVDDIVRRFESLWTDPRTIPLTRDWLRQYRPRAGMAVDHSQFMVLQEGVAAPVPTAIQRDALERLEQVRASGARSALVVMATGLGKTYLAAFDSRSFDRVLFVAHREEILRQSRDVFGRVRPDADRGLFHGEEKAPESGLLFAGVQTLARRLDEFAPDRFDYIVVDEFHHAAAASYRRIIDHFQPRFLLGLTATPERMDGQDLLALCGAGEPAYRCDLVEGIERGLLCPFVYFGIRDVVDFAPIPWRSGKFDTDALTKAVETGERADHALREWRARRGERTLAFCCTVTHADFMADRFASAGIPAVAVHTGSKSAPRKESIEALREGRIQVIFSVDVFNEGLDLPEIDTVLMLRPTESPVVFLQQLGRGLRKTTEAKTLRVIDFIGNHRSFLLKPRTLLSLGRQAPASVRDALGAMRSGDFDLPPGCRVEYDLGLIDMFRALVRLDRESDLELWCREVEAETGFRPAADQAYRAGLDPGAPRAAHGGWFRFLESLGMLADAERKALHEFGEFLRQIEVEPVTRSYKLVTIKAMVAEGALASGATIREIAAAARRLILKDPRLVAEVQADEVRDVERVPEPDWERYWRKWPIAAWTGELSGRARSWFRLEGDRFSTSFRIPAEATDALSAMTSEIIEWRLARHLVAREPLASGLLRCKIGHSGTGPVVRFPKRGRESLPDGAEIPFLADGVEYLGDFRSSTLQSARKPGEQGNALPAILRNWFGPAAGHAGRSDQVIFERTEESWVMRPVPALPEVSPAGGVVLPLFPNYAVACGAFDLPQPATVTESRLGIAPVAGREFGTDGAFLVHARGDSMDGGAEPIRHGDLVALRWAKGVGRDDLVGKVVLVQHGRGARAPAALKRLARDAGGFLLVSDRAEAGAGPMRAGPDDRILATLIRRLDPSEFNPLAGHLHEQFTREQIAPLHGQEFNPGNWNTGHVSLGGKAVLLITLDKEQMAQGADYHDALESPETLVWTSQSSTSREGKRGREILDSLETGTEIHAWIRRRKREPFTYCGLVVPVGDEGERPIRVTYRLLTPLPPEVYRRLTR